MAVALAGGSAFVSTPAGAGIATGATVTVVNAVAYDAENNFPLAVCIDGTFAGDLDTEEASDPIDLSPGNHQFEFIQGSDCSGSVFIDETLDIPAGQVTVMAYWPSDDPTAVVFADDTSCVENGETRVTFRHGAAWPAVNLFMEPSGGSWTEVASGVAAGQQSTTDIPAGSYTNSELRDPVTDNVVLDTGSPGDLQTGMVSTLYFYGGADGDTGWFVISSEVPVCEQPTTTTTAAPTTTTTAAPIAVVTPRYAG
ncbi:DUF4397 domain-containing protein [Rhabdothermincola sp.]|uniref:DUF4397 domain-containing protein n=1 Tax=Rhabdothermincola sp. TaxID=2820405 RepID=UPI002FE38AAF